MKTMTKNLLMIVVASCATTFMACNPNKDNYISDNQYVNQWILDTMQIYYYWNDKIPANLNKEQSSYDFFYSTLYKYKQPDGDRFSWIQDNFVELLNSLSGVNTGDVGFEMMMHQLSNSNKVIGEVLYVKPRTEAQAKGVKRGSVFDAINGIEMTKQNYSDLISLNHTSLTFRFSDPTIENGELKLNNARNTSLTVQQYAEHPVYMDTVYNIHGHKVGYLVYNFFATDAGDDSDMYDRQLNAIFGKFIYDGITDIIVDLRYNSGGSSMSATRLASMIVHPSKLSNIFYKLRFNSFLERYIGYNSEPFAQSITRNSNVAGESINNAGNTLQKVCFITSQWSASASEMLINGLKPYISNNNLIIVGDVTVGKSFGSLSFYNAHDSKNKWGIQPLVAKFTNGVNEEVPLTGIPPNYQLTEYNILPKAQIGDVTEILLNKALSEVIGVPVYAGSPSTESKHIVNEVTLGASVSNKPYSNHVILSHIK